MSHYIRCPSCLEETLDSDCLRCSECGHDEPLPPKVAALADCEFCHGEGFVLSPVDGWHSTDKRLREPCVCVEVQS